MVQYLDWLGLMTYDFTGSWDKTPFGPHAALYKLPMGTYPRQSTDNPIYSAQDALEYWMGIAEPAWNHDGGFSVPKSKLCIGMPVYGYDFANTKASGGNGYEFVPYKDIVAEFPNAATSYDSQEPGDLSGHVVGNGKDIYYDTPNAAKAKMNYVNDFGHQGVIVWEMSMDVDYQHPASLFKALNDAKGSVIDINNKPTVSLTSPANNTNFDLGNEITISATASDTDGTVNSVEFFVNNTSIGLDNSAPYSVSWTPNFAGTYIIKTVATDNENAKSAVSEMTISVTDPNSQNVAPVVSNLGINPNPVNEGEAVTVSVDASDADDNLASVVISVEGNIIATLTAAPFSTTLTAGTEGDYIVSVLATDSEGLTHSISGTFTVNQGDTNECTAPAWNPNQSNYNGGDQVAYNGRLYQAKWWTQQTPEGSTEWTDLGACDGSTDPQNSKPTATISVNATSVEINNTVTISATASDTDGTINSVEFFVNGTSIGLDTSAPYSVSWTPNAAGTYNMEAIATDNQNATSNTVSATVTATDSGNNNQGCGDIPTYQPYPAGIYNIGNQVVYNGIIYECQVNNLYNVTPGTAEHWWKTISACTGRLEAKSTTFDANLYPNPVSDLASVRLSLKDNSFVNVFVINTLGKKVAELSKQISAGNHTLRMNLDELPKGIYLMKIQANGQSLTRKFIKQ